ncbi:MAG: hypothetical protein KBT28_12490 [Bacteroidales bacterium]|nr:hypothetical protein [Candidatus Colimorpha merdihippi]
MTSQEKFAEALAKADRMMREITAERAKSEPVGNWFIFCDHPAVKLDLEMQGLTLDDAKRVCRSLQDTLKVGVRLRRMQPGKGSDG